VSLALSAAAAVLAACCGWPASRAVRAYTQRTIGPLLLAPPMALLAGLAAGLVHPGLVACAAAWLAICAVPLALIDALAFRLPDPLTLAALGGITALLVAVAAVSGDWAALGRAAAGAAALGGTFLALALARPGSAGLGDAKLSVSLGALTAWAGWDVLLGALAVAFVLAAGYGLWLIVAKGATLAARLPFGPFLLAGTLVAVIAAGH
jgi:leader peptidase (prepilin peptidase) / N-methyltransferase